MDDEGCVTPHNHDEIGPDDPMLRGIPSPQIIKKSGVRRVSSNAFQQSGDKYQGMSMGAQNQLECSGTSVEQWNNGRFEFVAVFNASEFRDKEMKVGWDPNPDDPAHCNAWGRSTRSKRRAFAKKATKQLTPEAT